MYCDVDKWQHPHSIAWRSSVRVRQGTRESSEYALYMHLHIELNITTVKSEHSTKTCLASSEYKNMNPWFLKVHRQEQG